MAIYSGFTHWKWWFSIVMLVYQRISLPFNQKPTFIPAAASTNCRSRSRTCARLLYSCALSTGSLHRTSKPWQVVYAALMFIMWETQCRKPTCVYYIYVCVCVDKVIYNTFVYEIISSSVLKSVDWEGKPWPVLVEGCCILDECKMVITPTGSLNCPQGLGSRMVPVTHNNADVWMHHICVPRMCQHTPVY